MKDNQKQAQAPTQKPVPAKATPAKQGADEEYKVGDKHPPRNRQFGQPEGNPRHNGAWKKEDTIRYKLEKMTKMTDDELKAIGADTTRPRFERKCAEVIYKGDWKQLREIIHEVYGTPGSGAQEGTIQRD